MGDKKRRAISRREFVQKAGAGAAGAVGAGSLPAPAAGAQGTCSSIPTTWDLEADVVVVGSGATGMPAAIRARDHGASVLVVDTNYDVGGHAMLCAGNIPLGGGTSAQKKYRIEDSPDLLFRDLTDWSVVESNKMPEYRYNDRGIQRALADNEAAAYEFLVENGVVFRDRAPDTMGGHAIGLSAPRENHVIWSQGQGAESPAGQNGASLIRPLEASARRKGVRFLLHYHMDAIVRETPTSGRVLGIRASYRPRVLPGQSAPLASFRSDGNLNVTASTVAIKAKKAVILATGGSTGNVNFRRIFDPRMTEEFLLAGEPYSPQDASGELASMAVGASLWGTANQTFERNGFLRKRDVIGCQYVYVQWMPESPMFPLARASGLAVRTWQDLILVNQVGKRFYNEMEGGWPNGTFAGHLSPYVPGDWRNPERTPYKAQNYLDAAAAINEGSTPPEFAAGPTWAIFDADAAKREKWDPRPPAIDPLYFFSADTLGALAAKIARNPFQKAEMPGTNLEATVARYNELVDAGVDSDFGKPSPKYRIAAPPFHAAWATAVIHDSYAGLRVNMKCQVTDTNGQVIAGLYCGGESAGGSSQHGTGRCITQGFIAGKEAAAEPSWDSPPRKTRR